MYLVGIIDMFIVIEIVTFINMIMSHVGTSIIISDINILIEILTFIEFMISVFFLCNCL